MQIIYLEYVTIYKKIMHEGRVMIMHEACVVMLVRRIKQYSLNSIEFQLSRMTVIVVQKLLYL